ncbi:hypothetical protein DdX_04181 [Ditylenchus destructor]|uniref:Uncharacterized protein n=1 Tax=Ditylenchus destructor TaxID=166010 RepID=A0AAD4R7I6_9BILA|nr:hypothetical protein DdX_04181 [Ditylenchus destructor]
MCSLFNFFVIFAALFIISGLVPVDAKNFDYLKAVYKRDIRKWVVQFKAGGSYVLQKAEIFYCSKEGVYYFNYCVGTGLMKKCKSLKINISRLSRDEQQHLSAYVTQHATHYDQHYKWGRSTWHTNVPGEVIEDIDSDNPETDDEY